MLPGMSQPHPIAVTAAGFSLTYTDTGFSTTGSVTSTTFSTRSIGAAGSGRRVIVCVSFFAGAGVPDISHASTTMTIGGVSATKNVTNTGDTIVQSGIFSAAAASDAATTADVVINWNTTASSAFRVFIAVYVVTGHGSDTPNSTANGGGASTSTSPTINCPAGGTIVGVRVSSGSNVQGYSSASKNYGSTQTGLTVGGSFSSGSSTFTWTQLVEDQSPSTSAITTSPSRLSYCAASWGP